MKRSRYTIAGIALVTLLIQPHARTVRASSMGASNVVMSSTGTFVHTTRLFLISASEWQVSWSYNCRPMGESGNFAVWLRTRSGDDVELVANQLGWGGHDLTYMHRSGTFYLAIESDCAWSVKVYGPRGSRLVPVGGSHTVIRASGNGPHQTQLFRVPSEWQIRWSYNCHPTGAKGNVAIWVKDRAGEDKVLAVNELAWSDYGTEYMHQGGLLYLSIESDCPFRITITQ